MPRPLAIAAVSGALLASSAVAGGAMLGHGAEPRFDVQASDSGPDTTGAARATGPTSATERPELRLSRSAERPSRSSERPSRAERPSRSSERLRRGDRNADAPVDDSAEAGRRAARAARAAASRERLAAADPRDMARSMLPQYGWSQSEFTCLDELWTGESDWEWNADNPTSSAYGIPQSLPGEKMASAGPDWLTNPATQIEWGLGYIRDVYGTPCSANVFKNANNWY